jgi:hypothetical protein
MLSASISAASSGWETFTREDLVAQEGHPPPQAQEALRYKNGVSLNPEK